MTLAMTLWVGSLVGVDSSSDCQGTYFIDFALSKNTRSFKTKNKKNKIALTLCNSCPQGQSSRRTIGFGLGEKRSCPLTYSCEKKAGG